MPIRQTPNESTTWSIKKKQQHRIGIVEILESVFSDIKLQAGN